MSTLRPITVDSFLSEDQCSALLTQLEQMPLDQAGIQHNLRSDWKKVSKFTVNDSVAASVSTVTTEITRTINEVYGVEARARDDGYVYRYSEGDYYRAHCDAQTVTRTQLGTVAYRRASSSDISSILYLNGDFEGGEIVFPFLDFEVKPATGKLLLFHSGWQNAHLVNPIVRGSRIAVVNWFVSQPNLIPPIQIVPEPYASKFGEWEQEYQTGQRIE